jgi:hypothetical protein
MAQQEGDDADRADRHKAVDDEALEARVAEGLELEQVLRDQRRRREQEPRNGEQAEQTVRRQVCPEVPAVGGKDVGDLDWVLEHAESDAGRRRVTTRGKAVHEVGVALRRRTVRRLDRVEEHEPQHAE